MLKKPPEIGGLTHKIRKIVFSYFRCPVFAFSVSRFTGSSRLTFGTYRKSSAAPVPPRDFTVRLYETGATVQGCSAFLAGQIATLNFGNPGQLDGQGVVTRGAGDGIRIDVRAADTQADFRGRITQANHEVKYPVDFAAKGQFRFRAQPVFPADVKAGEYNGALTFVVTYQ
ncbi:fimbrial protein [Salmonella enterica]|nr:fimbrial protein [Salmonella enterica]